MNSKASFRSSKLSRRGDNREVYAFTRIASSNRRLLCGVAQITSQVEDAAWKMVRPHPKTSPDGYVSICS
jgi:hypothetical protein